MKPKFFPTPSEFRVWLEGNHASERELLVGFYKKGSGKPSITWAESVDEALCFGWIDGVRRSLGAEAYSIRFTPRKPASIWSLINVARVAELDQRGKLAPAGRRAFAARTRGRTGLYSFERKAAAVLSAQEEERLRADAAAATWFDAQAPWYRRTALHWVTSAKRPETRARRLDELIRDSAAGRTIKTLTRSEGAEAAGPKAPKAVAPKPPKAVAPERPKAAAPKPTKAAPERPKAAAPKPTKAVAPERPKVASPRPTKAARSAAPRRQPAARGAAPKAPAEPAQRPSAEKRKASAEDERAPTSPAAAGASRPRSRRIALGNRVDRRPPESKG
jgi:uncharacterized protein YdeI (YjbR/CyaY-like superfamily)